MQSKWLTNCPCQRLNGLHRRGALTGQLNARDFVWWSGHLSRLVVNFSVATLSFIDKKFVNKIADRWPCLLTAKLYSARRPNSDWHWCKCQKWAYLEWRTGRQRAVSGSGTFPFPLSLPFSLFCTRRQIRNSDEVQWWGMRWQGDCYCHCWHCTERTKNDIGSPILPNYLLEKQETI